MATYTGGRYNERTHLFVGAGRYRLSLCGLRVSSQRRNYFSELKASSVQADAKILPWRPVTCQNCVLALQGKRFSLYYEKDT